MSDYRVSAQLVENHRTGKHRVLVVVEHEIVDLSFAMNANEAEALARSLMEFARLARGKQIILPGGGEA